MITSTAVTVVALLLAATLTIPASSYVRAQLSAPVAAASSLPAPALTLVR